MFKWDFFPDFVTSSMYLEGIMYILFLNHCQFCATYIELLSVSGEACLPNV